MLNIESKLDSISFLDYASPERPRSNKQQVPNLRSATTAIPVAIPKKHWRRAGKVFDVHTRGC